MTNSNLNANLNTPATYKQPCSIPQSLQENTTTLEYQSKQKQKAEKTGQKFIKKNKSRDGDFWEYYVGLEAWKRDAEVFRNLGKTGDADLVLVKDSDVLLCDVKQNTQTRIHNTRPSYDYYQTAISTVPEHVYMICVHPVSLRISWNTNRVPNGWEDFWD